MRKFLVLAALVLGLASCQNEPEGLNIVTGGEVDTVVTVTLPEATRASSADSGLVNVDPTAYDLRYILEVYDAAGDVFVYRAVETRATNATDARTVTFPVRLIPERSYNFVVWADFVYKNGSADLYYNTLNNTTYGLNAVTIANGKWVAMDEARDAYTAVEYVDSYNSGKSINLTLVRPFGKLRVITTDIEALKVLANNALPEAVKVTYTTDVYSGFNALTQAAVYKQGETTRPTFEYALDNAAVYRYTDTADSKMVLFTDYIFGTENGTIQFELTATYANGNTSTNNFNTEIPVQRNYLTTISGNILTDGNDIRVDITDGFENEQNPNNPPYYQETISSAAEFYAAVAPANAGKKYIVISALNLTSETISTLAATRAGEAATTTTIDLNGYTITVDNKSDDALITLAAGQTIVFTDSSANGNGQVVLADGSESLFDATQATVVVEGGSVDEDAVDGNFFVNDGDSENAASSLELLKHICANGGEFTFSQDLEGNVMVEQQLGKNIVINGNGYKFNGVFTIDGNGGGTSTPKPTNTLTFKNIKFETAETKDFISAPMPIDGHNNYAYNVIFDGCEFNCINDATVVGMRMKQVFGLTIKDCVTNNVHSLAQLTSCYDLLIEDTEINGGTGINLLTAIYGANIVNCTINATEADGFGIRSDANNYGDIKVKNCNITANTPIWVRYVTKDNCFKLALEGNTLTKGGLYDVVFTAGKDNLVIPTVSYEITGAENYSVFPTSAVVTTAQELAQAFANSVNIIELDADITLEGEWTPVGNAENPWYGVFDGKNHTISNLTINNSDYTAFIAYTAEGTTIKNLTFDNVAINSSKYGAALVCVAEKNTTIENVTVSGTVNATSYAAGIVLMNNDDDDNVIIKKCANNATVASKCAGGIAAWVTGGSTIEEVVNNGDITGEISACGITNRIQGSIKNAKNYGNIVGNGTEPSSGIAGTQKGVSTYEYCYNYGSVNTTADNANASAAGILGQTPGSGATLNYCANYGNITAEQSYAAGIAYSLYGSINANYCYNNGAVNGADGAGAIAPKAQYGAGDKANYCLNAGTVTSANGIVYQGSNNNTSCFYYYNDVLFDVKTNTETTTENALAILNGGTNNNFFSVEEGKITVK
ncbi:MAG: hypothetical protein IKW36_03575 [Alistipes sp.]|nr:hypothetical protein [Alistipes sp.]